MSKITRYLILSILLLPLGNQAQIQFSPYVAIATGSSPEVVAIGDVNNDGRNDVVMGTQYYNSSTNDYKILVFPQNSNGTLNTNYVGYSYLPGIGAINSIDIADLNQDNRKDVVIGRGTRLGIFYQKTNGTLDAVVNIETSQTITSLKCADMNNDSKTDIVVSYTNANFVSVYFQSSPGVFTGQNFASPNVNSFLEVELGDINNDSLKDIVCSSDFPLQGVCTFTQNSSHGFEAPVYTPYTAIMGVAIGDLTNDGKNDVAFTKNGNRPNSKMGIMYQNASSQLFDAPLELDAYDIPEPIEIADLNNNGKNEIIVANDGWMKVTIYEQNSSNVYSGYTLHDIPYASYYNRQGMDVGDINNDGKKDIVLADYNNGLIILYNTSTLDVRDNSIKAKVAIYPNPTNNYLNIDNKTSSELSYEIYETNGKLLQKGLLGETSVVDVSQFQTGLYFLLLKNHQETTTYKFIKN